jgi:hypothetical protein
LFVIFIFISSNLLFNFEEVNAEINYLNNDNTGKNAFVFTEFYNDELDQNQSENSGEGFFINDEIWYSQSFKPSKQILTRVKIFLSKVGEVSDQRLITFIIRDSLYRENIFITSFNVSEIENDGSWIEINDINLSVSPGINYFIILRSKLKISDEGIKWHYELNNPYMIGDGYQTENQGESWYKLENQPQYPGLDFCFKTYGNVNHAPNKPIKPTGETEGHYEKNYSYNTSSIDLDDNILYYYWDWGDGTNSGWLGPYDSGELCMATHMWMIKGSYLVKVKVKDQWTIESEWSDILTVKMEKRKISNLIKMTINKLLNLNNI